MKVSISWLKELVKIKDVKEIIRLLPLRTIGTKEITEDFIELDMKGYNRADLLSMRGVAREVSAITDSEISFSDEEELKTNLSQTPVEIEDESLSPLQCVAKIEGLKTSQSSADRIKILADCGMRPVNNIADVTNLIMLEYGQPLHAFDAATVRGELINVRLATKGEEIVTLDGKLRKLEPTDIVLADSEKPLDVAGVMGGKNTEVKDPTTTVLLSASLFNPGMVRKTAQRLGLHSEASKRFQHGLTKTNLLQALSAAIKMYEQIGGKLTALTLVGNLEDEIKTIKLNQEKINSLIGVNIPKEQIEKSLQSLGFHLRGVRTNLWEVEIPFWRLDINIEEDLIEEVARMYGYENIPPQELQGKLPDKIDQTLPNLIYNLKKQLADLGLTEVQTYSFYSSQVISNFEFRASDLIKIANPISSETEFMRDNLWSNLLEVTTKNIKQGFKDIAIFEIGKVYSPPDKEIYHLAIALMNGSDNPIQELNVILNPSLRSRVNSVKNLLRMQGKLNNKKYFHPTRFTENMAEVHPRIVNKFGIDNRVAILELEIEVIDDHDYP